MSQERDQSGALFKNDRKQKDSHPDYQGKAIVNGTPVYVSAWLKDKPSGGKYLSLAFKNRPGNIGSSSKPEDDMDVPF